MRIRDWLHMGAVFVVVSLVAVWALSVGCSPAPETETVEIQAGPPDEADWPIHVRHAIADSLFRKDLKALVDSLHDANRPPDKAAFVRDAATPGVGDSSPAATLGDLVVPDGADSVVYWISGERVPVEIKWGGLQNYVIDHKRNRYAIPDSITFGDSTEAN